MFKIIWKNCNKIKEMQNNELFQLRNVQTGFKASAPFK